MRTSKRRPPRFFGIRRERGAACPSELKRKLERLGCTFAQGTRHLVVYYKGNRTFEAAFAALNKQLIIGVSDKAA
jgi:hypothetical protein